MKKERPLVDTGKYRFHPVIEIKLDERSLPFPFMFPY